MKINFKIVTYILGLISLVSIAFGYYYGSNTVLFSGVFLVVFTVFFHVFQASYEMFRKDKEIDYDMVSKLNLTLTTCSNCEKENVLEDKYCKFCGEELIK